MSTQICFNQENPYSQLEMDRQVAYWAEYGRGHRRWTGIYGIEFCDISDSIEVYNVPACHVSICNSPNIIFMTPNDKVKSLRAMESLKFDDEMFPNLSCLTIGGSRYLEMMNNLMHLNPGQLRLRNVRSLQMCNAILHVDSLRDAHVKIMYMSYTQIPQLDTTNVLIPVLPPGFSKLIIQTVEDVRLLVCMTSIPDSMRSLVLPFGFLSEQAVELLHSHNQRLRYLFGPTTKQLRLFYDNQRGGDNLSPQNFTKTNDIRDRVADYTQSLARRILGDSAASLVLQYVYGDYYILAKFGTALETRMEAVRDKRKREE